jgi:hypothetical protein
MVLGCLAIEPHDQRFSLRLTCGHVMIGMIFSYSKVLLLNVIMLSACHYRALLGRGISSTAFQQKSNDVVVTFAKRTAIGKAKKGQFKDVPVDKMLHALFKVDRDPIVERSA